MLSKVPFYGNAKEQNINCNNKLQISQLINVIYNIIQYNGLIHHDVNKLFVINLAVPIDVSLPDHFVNFLLSQLLT